MNRKISASSEVGLVSCFAYSDGIRWHWRQSQMFGPEAPVILIHDLILSATDIIPLASRISEWAPVYLPDLPGFGLSSGQERPLPITEMADSFVSWMETAGIQPAHIVANSFGCQLAADIAIRRPEMVRSLTLVGPTLDPCARGLAAGSTRFVAAMFSEPVQLLAERFTGYARNGITETRRAFRIMLDDRIEEKLPFIGVPSLVLRGLHDPIASQRWIYKAANLLRDGSAGTLPAGGHCVEFSHPALVASAVRRFTASVPEEFAA
jgi:pimeloyl-ACP methyl ester carboxylesterase